MTNKYIGQRHHQRSKWISCDLVSGFNQFFSEYNFFILWNYMRYYNILHSEMINFHDNYEGDWRNNVKGFDKSLVRAGDIEGWRGTNVYKFFIPLWSQYFSRYLPMQCMFYTILSSNRSSIHKRAKNEQQSIMPKLWRMFRNKLLATSLS